MHGHRVKFHTYSRLPEFLTGKEGYSTYTVALEKRSPEELEEEYHEIAPLPNNLYNVLTKALQGGLQGGRDVIR